MSMTDKESEHLKNKGYRVTTVSEFLELTEAEERLVEIRLALSDLLRRQRRESGATQAQLAEMIQSSQPRIAKMESADETVSAELLIRALIVAGATNDQIADAIRSGPSASNGTVHGKIHSKTSGKSTLIEHPPQTAFYAHTPPKDNPTHWQTMYDHTRGVARCAAEFGTPFGAQEVARLAALLHDVGKYRPAFQDYLKQCHSAALGIGAAPRAGSVEHKSAGARLAREILPSQIRDLTAMAILGHHGGLNAKSETLNLLKDGASAQDWEAAANLARADDPSLAGLSPSSVTAPDLSAFKNEGEDGKLSLELYLRMIFSCLVDADSLDTEQHFDTKQAALRAKSGGSLTDHLARWRQKLEASQASRQANAPDTDVNTVRREVYAACLEAAKLPPGVFTLAVPTGGGKTLSSLAFALNHAEANGLLRIIYAIPYTSIIDQTVRVFQGVLGNEGIIEHHSAIDAPTKGSAAPVDRGELEREQLRRLASENWDAPLIVTTTVQLFESLFARNTGRCRKLHNIARSVIILDEVQALPPHLLTPILSGLRSLAKHFGVSIVLCTATQPAFGGETPTLKGFEQVTPIIADETQKVHFEQLRRVTYRVETESWDWMRVADEMRSGGASCLAVLNTKKDALALLDALRAQGVENAAHLSTLLCGAHRKRVLANVTSALEAERNGGSPILLVATQVIEAGCDIDFPRVLRAEGPLERIIQAAGRCNREGRRARDASEVVVFKPSEGGLPPGDYKTMTDITRTRILREKDATGAFDFDSPTVATDYFKELYDTLRDDLDRKKVQDSRRSMNFPEVADKMRLIEDDTIPVLVPYDKEFYDKMLSEIAMRQKLGLGVSRELWRQLQPHTVAIYKTETKKQQHLLTEIVPDQLWAWLGKYDNVTGIGGMVARDPADLIV